MILWVIFLYCICITPSARICQWIVRSSHLLRCLNLFRFLSKKKQQQLAQYLIIDKWKICILKINRFLLTKQLFIFIDCIESNWNHKQNLINFMINIILFWLELYFMINWQKSNINKYGLLRRKSYKCWITC